ncbi:MAG: extracellular solute-binding protein [Alphaproteobacteria bacterium]|nr:extracellular solute-binding protein [Alphaproteobacteria bacterium]
MKRILATLAAAFVTVSVAAPIGPASAQPSRELFVVGFGGGFQDAARTTLFQAFQAATGQRVRDDTYNGELARIYAMVRSRDVVWDVVMVEAPELQRGCEDGAFAPIDWSVVRRDKFVPAGATRCGAGAVAWGAALFYDTARNPQAPANMAELWDVARFPGKRSFRFGPKMTLEIALMSDGVPREQVYRVLSTPAGLQRAFDRLEQIRPHIVWWRSGAQPLQFVGSGEVAYAFGFTGRVVQANQQGARYNMLWDTLLYSVDYWAVVNGSPYAQQGMRMIEWMTNLEPLQALARIWPASPAHRAFQEDATLRAASPHSVAANASRGLFIDTEFWVQNGEDLERRFAAWAGR